MKSHVLRLSGMVGRPVSCIAPVSTCNQSPELAYPAVGQKGRIVGFIEDDEDYSVFVLMEGEFDFCQVSRTSLDSHFRVMAL